MTETNPDRVVRVETIVPAGIDAAWEAWTTEEGVRSFLAPDCEIELRVDGAYHIFFDPEAEPGMRGADDMRILAIQPPKMLSFDWNAPLRFPEIRLQKTHVVVRLAEVESGKTRVTLIHDGWGEGEEWDQVYEYFWRGWGRTVLPLLAYRFLHGPVDWRNPPDLHREDR